MSDDVFSKTRDAGFSYSRSDKMSPLPDGSISGKPYSGLLLHPFSAERHPSAKTELMSLSQLAKRRRTFVQLAEKQQCSFSQLCAQFQISRSTGYRWLARYREKGLLALSDNSRRPKNSPTRISQEIRDEVLQIRRQHKAWGATRIRRVLEQKYGDDTPSASTINRLLKKH